MARRVSKKGMIRLIKPDLKYKNFLVSKFINLLMNGGKKSISERIVYEAFDLIRLSFKLNPLWVFLQVIESSRPIAEVKKKKVGGSVYNVPISISDSRSYFLVMKWLKENSILRKEKRFSIALFKELIDTYNGCSETVNKKDCLHRLVESNRAFSFFSF